MDTVAPASLDVEKELEILTSLGAKLINAVLEHEPLGNIKTLIDAGAPLWYQDETEGMSPLHAAAHADAENDELVKFLINEGVVWNAVDNLHNTAGDIALSLNNKLCYTAIRDAGIRAELLLTLLASRTSLESTSLAFKASDSAATGSTDAFLSSRLRFTVDSHGQHICLLKTEDEEVGVMMGWERGIMQDTVSKLCAEHQNLSEGLKVLNIGFGLGIIDTLFQSLRTPPSKHVIIEPHPDVLQHMRNLDWYNKPGVKILEGKWQDFVDSEELLTVGGFDVIYIDTFSEDYPSLHQFFCHLPDLLAGAESRFSFFNGLGATNALFYDVYTRLSDFHLENIGIEVEWSDVDLTQGNEDRWGNTRKYFTMPFYRLPVGRMRTI